MSREIYFFIVSRYFLCMCWWFSKSFKSFSLYLYINTFCLLLWNDLLILKMLNKILLRIPFSVIGRCSLVPTSHWLQGKCSRINLSQAASGTILQNLRWLPVSVFSVKISALGPLKLATGRIFKISKYIILKKQAKTLSLIFFIYWETKNCENYQGMYIVQTVPYLLAIKKNFHHLTQSFKDQSKTVISCVENSLDLKVPEYSYVR